MEPSTNNSLRIIQLHLRQLVVYQRDKVLILPPNGLTGHGDSQICHADEKYMYKHMHFDQ